MTSTIEKLNELQEAQGSDGILEMMADRDGSAFLLDKFFALMSEAECDDWLVWLRSNLITSTQRNPMKKSFKVCLSKMDNQNSLNFIIVENCVDMDECIEHIHSTERGWVINSIKQI